MKAITIERWLEFKPPSCSCDVCVHMCSHPCWGTPQEIRKIIDAGYGDRLMLDYWEALPNNTYILCGALPGHETRLAPYWVRGNGYCVFLENDLCKLHDAGLKPLEGVMAHHDDDLDAPPEFGNIHRWVAMQWDTDEGRQLVREWRKQYNMWDVSKISDEIPESER